MGRGGSTVLIAKRIANVNRNLTIHLIVILVKLGSFARTATVCPQGDGPAGGSCLHFGLAQ